MQDYYLCDDRFSCTCRVAGYFRISFLNSVCRGGRDRMELGALGTISIVAADLTYSWKRPKRVPDITRKTIFSSRWNQANISRIRFDCFSNHGYGHS